MEMFVDVTEVKLSLEREKEQDADLWWVEQWFSVGVVSGLISTNILENHEWQLLI